MYEYGSLPRARRDGLLEETVGEELLLYDRGSHTAHCLSPIAACVWRHCDGEHDATELAALAGASESVVADALHELREKYLLDAEPELLPSTILGVSRREAISRAACYGAAAAAGSMIVSATAATPATASSGGGTVCYSCETTLGPCWCGLGAYNVTTCQAACETNAGTNCKVNVKVRALAICSGSPTWVCS